jgi:hypothetical protein
MTRDAEIEGFVDVAVDVGELDLDVIDGRAEGHAGILRGDAPTAYFFSTAARAFFALSTTIVSPSI